MDRNWQYPACSGPERPRVGQQPYDRGRGVPGDRRGVCYACGQDGHIRKFCPQMQEGGRYWTPAKFMGNNIGRSGNESWQSLRNSSSAGREHGYSRSEGMRESGGSRRSHFDYHDIGDFSGQRSRDTGERHRDKDSRSGHGIMAPCNAVVTERGSRHDRAASRKAADQNHEAGGGHRGEDRRDSRNRDGASKCEEWGASSENFDSSATGLLVGGEDIIEPKAVLEEKLVSKSSCPEVEFGIQGCGQGAERLSKSPSRDEYISHESSGGNAKEDVATFKRDRFHRNETLHDKDGQGMSDYGSKGKLLSRRLTGSKPSLSVLCKDAEELSEKKQRLEKSALSSVAGGATPDGLVRSLSGQKLDAEGISIGQQDNIWNRDAVTGTESEQQNDSESIKSKNVGEDGQSHDVSPQGDVRERNESPGTDEGFSKLAAEREMSYLEGSDNDRFASVKPGDVSEGDDRLFHLRSAEQDADYQLESHSFLSKICQSPAKESLSMERDIPLCHPQNAISDEVKVETAFCDREDDAEKYIERHEKNGRRGHPDFHLKDGESDFRETESEDFENSKGIRAFQNDFLGYRSENMNSSCSGTPFRGRHFSRDTEYLQHLHAGFGSREASVDGTADRNHYASYGRFGLKAEYRCVDYGFGPDKIGEWSGITNASKFRMGDNDRDQPAWVIEARLSRIWESHPGHRLYRPGSYVDVCNARFLRTKGPSPVVTSPPSYPPVTPLEPLLPFSLREDVGNTVNNEGNAWMYHDLQGILHGPVGFAQLMELHENGQVQSDYKVPVEENNRWAALEHTRPPHSTFVPRSVENEQVSVTRSPGPSQVALQLPVPADQEQVLEEKYYLENADQDICPPGTEALCPSSEDYEDFHIDERVEKLMEGRILIPGEEKDIVYEALSIASSRVRQEYESDIAVEDSPRSHGGFAEMGDHWKEGDFGTETQGFDSFRVEQPATKLNDSKVEETPAETGPECDARGPSASASASQAGSRGPAHVESTQELWKWPSRGGDWKIIFVSDHSQHAKGEGLAPVEKGYPVHPKKVILNGGRPLCDYTKMNTVDPRKQIRETGRVAEAVRLLLPKFAHKVTASMINGSYNSLSQFQRTGTPALKSHSAVAVRSQGSTPNGDISTPGKERPTALVGSSNTKKPGKNSLPQGLGTGIGSKSFVHIKQPKALGKGIRPGGIVNSGESVVAEKYSATMETSFKQGFLRSEASLNDVDSKSASDAGDMSFLDDMSGQKRKSLSSDDGEFFAQRRTTSQRRRIHGNEDTDGDKVPALSSYVSHANSYMPSLIEDNPAKPSGVDRLKVRHQGEELPEDRDWASLESSILRSIFHSLHGDVKTLVYATVTCKSWLAAGRRCKTELQLADLSLVEGHSLDAVLESLPEFGGGNLQKIIFKGCSVKPDSLRHLLVACPSISNVQIACNEDLKEVFCSFPNVKLVGDHNGMQNHLEHVARRRQESHPKSRNLKRIGFPETSSKDGGEFEMHVLSDSASKAISPDLYASVTSMLDETAVNDSTQESSITHFVHGFSDGGKRLKSNFGGTTLKVNGFNGTLKSAKAENGNNFFHTPSKRKVLALSSHRNLAKNSHRMSNPSVGGQRVLADKHSSTTVKMFHHSKVVSSSMFDGDKTLEKEITMILKEMMDVDTYKCFQVVNSPAAEGKGAPFVSVKAPDLLAMEKKLKAGAYSGGKHGLNTFKEDINQLIRAAFRNDKDKLTYSAAEKIFKVAHQQFAQLESQLNGTVPTESNHSGKIPGAQQFKRGGKGVLKTHPAYQHRPGQKRKAWRMEEVSKGKFGVVKKSRLADCSSGDQDSDSDSTELERRRYLKSKKELRWDSEGESSEDDEEVPFVEEDEETTETEASDSEIPSESEGEDGILEDEYNDTDDEQMEYLNWGARMTKAAMVPPVPRKYVVIEEYRIVEDRGRVEQKMKVKLPRDYEARRLASNDKSNDSFSHLDMPEVREYKPRKKLGEEVLEQEVYGIDPYTHNLLCDTMPADMEGFPESRRQQFIEERLLLALNKEVYKFTGSDKAPTKFYLDVVVGRIQTEAEAEKDWALKDFCEQLHKNMKSRPKDEFAAYRKGLGVVCNMDNGLDKDEFVVEFFGEVYPPWRWYEKQDGIRSLQKKEKDTTPEFYNIFYERPKGDDAGYDLLVVDAMHKANFASRLCHSCRPNCEAKITAVDDKYIIGVYTLKPIKWGEELTFDYNSVTESKEEYNNAVCLCGSQRCKGSYLNLTGSGTYEEVILKHHGLLDRHRLLLDSSATNSLTEKEWKEMRQAGLGSCLLAGLPPWVLNYAASLVSFMNFEKKDLPTELRLKQGVIEGFTEVDHEITAEGVYNQRLQNLAITLDKVRHVLSEIFEDPSKAPSPLKRLSPTETVHWIWKREDSVLHELLSCLTPHLSKDTLLDLRQGISKHMPIDQPTLRESLLWLRDELRRLPATCRARHDAAADLIHLYAHTKCFFSIEDYQVVESTPISILPLDLGSNRHSISGPRNWRKTYSKEYVWGQLIGWYKQSVVDPGASLTKAARGCLMLPDVSSCYAKSMQHDFRLGYGSRHREKMISHMEDKPQQKWPNSKFWSQFWCFKNERGLFGSPMLDSVLEDRSLDCQMVEWLKSRESVFVGPWDEQ